MSLLSENIFINGSFDVWLNGTEFTDISSETEVASKWFVNTVDGTLGSASLSESVPENSVCENSLELSDGDEDMSVEILQRIDARYAAQMQRIVIFSAMVYNGTTSAFTPELIVTIPQGGTTPTRSVSLQECAPDAWTKVVQALDLSDEEDLSEGCEFGIQFTLLSEDDLIRVTAMKLESSGLATDFTRRYYEQELSLCKGESYLDSSLFDQDNTLLKADTAETPVSLVVGENTLVGNMGGGIAALTAAQAMPLWAALPDHYERDQVWTKSSASNITLLSPNRMTVNINDVGFYLDNQEALDLSGADSWDNTDTDYTVAATRAGLDFCVYACDDSGELKFLVSRNSTHPVDSDDSERWDDTNTRKIGGFHCLCADVGTITDHDLSGYVAGDILPASVWDMKHRPVCDPTGMTYSDTAKLWVDIYLQSETGTSTASVKGGTATVSRNWIDFVYDLGFLGKRLLTDYEFQLIANGSNEETNIEGSAVPTDGNGVGGRKDTAGRAMISNCGCWECCGYLWQWLLDQSYRYDSYSWSWKDLGNGKGSIRSQDPFGDDKLVAGGYWLAGSYCGSQSRAMNSYRWDVVANVGARGCCSSL